jgi:CHASE3 domain sensor protein
MLQSFHQGQLDAQKDREALGKTLGEMITEGARRQEERHDQLAQQLATQKGSFGMFRWIVDSVILLCGAAMTEVVTRFFR